MGEQVFLFCFVLLFIYISFLMQAFKELINTYFIINKVHKVLVASLFYFNNTTSTILYGSKLFWRVSNELFRVLLFYISFYYMNICVPFYKLFFSFLNSYETFIQYYMFSFFNTDTNKEGWFSGDIIHPLDMKVRTISVFQIVFSSLCNIWDSIL